MLIFDLDGTLADNSHRQHFVDGEVKDWDAFFQACDKDTPTIWCSVMGSLWAHKHDVMIWSGRSGIVRGKTESWLDKHVYHPRNIVGKPQLRMRAEGDYTPDEQLKEQWLCELLVAGRTISAVFDDRKKVVDMWRKHGVPCAQVAPGDF